MQHLRPAIVLVVLFTVLTGLAFPLAFVGIAGAAFPGQAGGSLIEQNGKVIGSSLLGQTFTEDKYFQGRPSATTNPDPADSTKTVPAPYNGANSSGSNAGPTAKSLIDRVTEDTGKLGGKAGAKPVPGDMVTTSASAHLAGDRGPAGGPRRRRPFHAGSPGAGSGGRAYRGPSARPDRRAAGQRAGAEHGAGRANAGRQARLIAY